MDAGGRATHGAVAESSSKHDRNQLVQRLLNKATLPHPFLDAIPAHFAASAAS